MFLKYDIGIVGLKKVDRALGALERRYRVHNQRVARGGSGGAARGGAVGAAEQKRHAVAMGNVAKEAAAKTRAVERAAAKEERLQTRAWRKQEVAQQRQHQARLRQRTREAKVAAAAETRTRRARGAMMAGSVGRGVRGVGTVLGTGLAIGGGFMAASAINRENTLDRELRELASAAYEQGGPKTRKELYATFRKQAVSAGAGGKGALSAAAGIRKFGEVTGAYGIGGALGGKFADIAMVSGAEISDVAGVAAEVQQVLTKKGIDPKFGKTSQEKANLAAQAEKTISNVLMTMLQQGKAGSIEFADFAQIGPQIGAAAGKLLQGDKQMSVEKAFVELSAFAQLSRMGGAASAAEAGTAVQRMMDDLVEKKSWEKLGIDKYTYEERGGKRRKVGIKSPLMLMAQAAEATGGDVSELQKLFGIRGRKGGGEIISMIAGLGKGDTAKGWQEFMNIYKPLTEMMTKEEFGGGLAFAKQGKSMQWAAAKEKFEEKVGPRLAEMMMRLLPAVQKLIPVFEKAVGAAADFAEWFAENPLAGIGALIAASMVKDIAAAGIGSALSSSFAGTGTAATGLAAKLGAAGLMIGGVALAIEQAMKLLDVLGDDSLTDAMDYANDTKTRAATALELEEKQRGKLGAVAEFTEPGFFGDKQMYATRNDAGELRVSEVRPLAGGLSEGAAEALWKQTGDESGAVGLKDSAAALKASATAIKDAAASLGGNITGGFGANTTSEPSMPRPSGAIRGEF